LNCHHIATWLLGGLLATLPAGLFARSGVADPPVSAKTPETVVLLHGLGRASDAMDSIAKRLRKAGYEVIGIDYPSRKLPENALLALIRHRVISCCAYKRRVHFVGHSLGGLLIRGLLESRPLNNLGRVVLLGTPNHGSELADRLKAADLEWVNVIAGPTALRLGTDANSFPNRLKAPYYEIGVIAGNRSLNPIGSWLIPGPDDGMVSIASTRLTGMSDFLIAPADHILMRYSKRIASAIIHFLRHGRFPLEDGSQ